MRVGGQAIQSGTPSAGARGYPKSGQASTETIAIMGATLLVMLVFFVYASGLLSDMNARQNIDDARSSVRALAASADSVFAQGEGASETVRVTLPTNTKFGDDKTYIGAPSFVPTAPHKTINIRLDDNDIFAVTRAPLSGSFPSLHGTYVMNVVSRGTYVQIHRDIAEVNKKSVYVSMSANDARNESISIYPTSSEELDILADFSIHDSNALGTVTPSSARVRFEGGTLYLEFSTASATPGVYGSDLSIRATGASTNLTENFTIPVTMVVLG